VQFNFDRGVLSTFFRIERSKQDFNASCSVPDLIQIGTTEQLGDIHSATNKIQLTSHPISESWMLATPPLRNINSKRVRQNNPL
jgi:hypothetical protein